MWNRDSQPSAASANLDGAPHGFKVTGDAAWDSDSTDYAMFSEAGNQAVAAMVKTARLMATGGNPEAAVAEWVRAEMERLDRDTGTYPYLPHLRKAGGGTITGHSEVWDTMVRETIAGALDRVWEQAYGHRFEMEFFEGDGDD